MGKTLNRDGRVRPVDVSSLFQRLALALEVPEGIGGGPAQWIDLPFPDQGLDVEKFRDQYLLKEVVRKYPGFDLGIDTRAAAVASFLEDEAVNAETNDRLNRLPTSDEVRARQLMFAAGRKAVSVLGRFPWDRFLKALRFGPGSTTRLARKDASVYGKLTGTPTVSRRALPLAREIMSMLPGWAYRNNLTDTIEEADLALRLCEYDLLRSVTKNAKTDRTIGIPNDMQILMQLAVGYCFRLCLWKAGINLNDQSINQRRAWEGSVTGKRATVDLRSASNSVTRVLVWRMYGDHPHEVGTFDPTWYEVMDTLRAQYALVDGESDLHEYELFSAMGNGFTFELESLTFWAIAVVVCEYLDVPPDVTVYGDDLVVPVETVELLTEVLAYCGFRLNTDKTFSDDRPSFRESCGKHYLRGTDVSPFYVDTELDTVSSIVVLANNITRWSARGLWRDGRLLPVWTWVISHLPDWALECTIPLGESDDGLIMDFDQACPSVAYSEGVKRGMPKTMLGYRCKTFDEGTRKILVSGRAGYVTWLYNQSYVRFTPPAAAVLKDRQVLWVPRKGKYPTELRLGQGSDLFEAFNLVAPREQTRRPNGQKVSTREVRRTVSHWPYLGPWVKDDEVTELSHIDVKLCASLARLT